MDIKCIHSHQNIFLKECRLENIILLDYVCFFFHCNNIIFIAGYKMLACCKMLSCLHGMPPKALFNLIFTTPQWDWQWQYHWVYSELFESWINHLAEDYNKREHNRVTLEVNLLGSLLFLYLHSPGFIS